MTERPPGGALLVVGGSGTIGGALVRALQAAGQPGRFTYFQGAEAARRLREETGWEALAVDLRQGAEVVRLAERNAEAPRAIVWCAGQAPRGGIEETTDADWEATMALSARAPFQLLRALLPRMAAAGGGSVVMVGSLAAVQSLRVPVAMAAAHAAQAGLVRAVAKEWGRRGICCNHALIADLGVGASEAADPGLVSAYLSHSALGRRGRLDEVVPALSRLALSPGWMTGATLHLTGGL